jgi:hypothetical protein
MTRRCPHCAAPAPDPDLRTVAPSGFIATFTVRGVHAHLGPLPRDPIITKENTVIHIDILNEVLPKRPTDWGPRERALIIDTYAGILVRLDALIDAMTEFADRDEDDLSSDDRHRLALLRLDRSEVESDGKLLDGLVHLACVAAAR